MADNKRKLTFIKSNYTLRTKHKSLNKKNSDIYVRDYMVTTNNGGWDSGSIPYGESNFKIVHRFDKKQARKHDYGKWLSNGESDVWTLEDIKNNLSKNNNTITNEKQMMLNTSYTSLLDFAYFGSCVELVKSSIKDIISKFPGELYVTDKQCIYEDPKTGEVVVLKGNTKVTGYERIDDFNTDETKTDFDLYLIDNPFGIDIFTPSTSSNLNDDLKYFCNYRNSYKILNTHDEICDIEMNRWIVDIDKNVDFKCLKEGQYIGSVLLSGLYDGKIVYRKKRTYSDSDIINYNKSTFIIYIYFLNGQITYLTDTEWKGFHVRLSDAKIEEYYNEKLDDFERFLMNRWSKPRFMIEIDSLKETDFGLTYGKMKLNWPTIGGWNLDVESVNYEDYVSKLLEQAEFYDQYYSNNLLRMLTHDSIKNMDLTFSNIQLNEDSDDYNIGTSKMEGLFWAYGREFDDLKRYIDNLKVVNKTSYNSDTPTPDSIIKDKLELNGWEIYDPVKTLDVNTEVKELYPNQFKSYTINDVKTRFFNELLLNSKNIFTQKGTKSGIETLMSLFGFCSYDYAKNLYPYLSKNEQVYSKPKWNDLNSKEKQTYYDYVIDEYVAVATNKNSDVLPMEDDFPCEIYNQMTSNFILRDEYNMDVDTLDGLPVREVDIVLTDGTEKKYLIPWFDKALYKNKKMYFQMYGGWNKISLKLIDEKIRVNNSITKHYNELRSSENFKIYSETLKYLQTKNTVQDLLLTDYDDLNNGDIYYVMRPKDNEYHYYILIDKEESNKISGWKPITENDFDNKTENALKVIYLESLIDDYKGNNPHTGHDKYDDGNEYLEYFRHLFKYEIEHDSENAPLFRDDAYTCEEGVSKEIQDCGFSVSDIIRDNMKVWYFSPTDFSYMELLDKNVDSGIYSISSTSLSQKINVGKKASDEGKTHFESDLSAFNLETQETDSNDEAAANSIINVKNLTIKFATKFVNLNGFQMYLYNVIVPYLTQIIPSTTILNIEFEGVESADVANYEFIQIAGIT